MRSNGLPLPLAEEHIVNTWQVTVELFNSAMHGMAQPWTIAVALALTTLLLEDVAIAAGVAMATQGAVSWELAFAAVAGGIAAGDVGLYGLGMAANRVPLLRHKYIEGRSPWASEQLRRRLPSAVMLARVIPGLRLVTYTACGFLRVALGPFIAWVLLAVALWTAGLFWFSSALGAVISSTFHIPAPLAVALPIVALALVLPLLGRIKRRYYPKPT